MESEKNKIMIPKEGLEPELENLISLAGRPEVFMLAMQSGWTPMHPPPPAVWQEFALMVLRSQSATSGTLQ